MFQEMLNIEGCLSKLDTYLNSISNLTWGIADICGLHQLADRYSCAITLAIGFNIAEGEYDEAELHDTQVKEMQEMEIMIEGISEILRRYHIGHLIIPSIQEEKNLTSLFPHKMAAVSAGIGWIGKSSLLVTPQFGPRVRLETILIDIPNSWATREESGACGDCMLCVDACPHGCIKGIEWNSTISRDELFDFKLCNQKRLEALSDLGRKHACGYCLLACPFGKKEE